jgi:hypothetical protein
MCRPIFHRKQQRLPESIMVAAERQAAGRKEEGGRRKDGGKAEGDPH